MTDQHYAEPEAEGAARAAQLVAMSVTVLEAVARLRAQRIAERADADERAAGAARAQRIADHAAARLAWAPAYDRDWLLQASTEALGRAWAAGEPWAATDPHAAGAVDRIVARLHSLHPETMAAFQEARAEGADAAEAMRRAGPLFARPLTLEATPSPEVQPDAAESTYPRPPRVISADGYPYPTSDAVDPSRVRPATSPVAATPVRNLTHARSRHPL